MLRASALQPADGISIFKLHRCRSGGFVLASGGIYLSGGVITAIIIGFAVVKAGMWIERAHNDGKRAAVVTQVREAAAKRADMDLSDYADEREALRRARNDARAVGNHKLADQLQKRLQKHFS
jgi:hypothetical protein